MYIMYFDHIYPLYSKIHSIPPNLLSFFMFFITYQV